MTIQEYNNKARGEINGILRFGCPTAAHQRTD